MVTLRPVARAERTVSTEPIVNDYTDLVVEMFETEQKRAKGEDRLEAVIEADEFPEGTTAKSVRLDINKTARTHNIGLNFKTGKDEFPIVFSVSLPRASADESTEPAAADAGKSVPVAA